MEITHEEAIKTLGFSAKEAKIYLALLEIGIGSVISIAKKTEIKRPTVYVILDELIEKGAIFVVPESKKKLYRAMPPQNLFELYQERFSNARKKLPEIQAISRQESYKPHVVLFEGIEGVKRALRYGMELLSEKTIRGFYAKTTPKILKQFDNYDEYNNLLKKNFVTMKGIAPEDPSLKVFRSDDPKFGRKFIEISPDEYSSDVAIEISDNFVRFFDPVNLQALIIENPAIAKTMNEIFELVWKKSLDK